MLIKPPFDRFKRSPKSTTLIRVSCMLLILYAAKSNAACPREDVTYYLNQGFNHEQIVTLCSVPSAKADHRSQPQISQNNKPTQPIKSPPSSYHEASGIYGNPDAVFLATAIEAYDVEVTEEAIIFTRKDCFNFGKEDLNGFQDRACPNVKYAISRGGLKIVDRDNGVFGMGSTALYISGKINAEILGLDQFQVNYHKKIKAVIQNNTEKLKIDVRSGMPQSKVEAILLRLAG